VCLKNNFISRDVCLNVFSRRVSVFANVTNTAPTVPETTSLEEARGVIAQQFQQLGTLAQQLQQALWRVSQLEKQLYGASSERQTAGTFSKEQILLTLFAQAVVPATSEVVLPVTPETSGPRVSRQPAAAVLEVITERIEPVEKDCPHCGKTKCEIGCEQSERYEYVPARIIRHEMLRPKLACPCKQSGVSIAPLPPQVIEQGQAGASLVAQVLLSKYADHLPLYRQQQQFARLGVNFPQSTLGGWVEKGARWLQPLAREIKAELLAGDYVQVDETPVRVQDPDVKGKCATGYLWVLGKPGGDVVFEFHPGRGKEHAQTLLGGFQGYLQRDGYGVYGSLARDDAGLIPVGCWAHARRKFVEALDEQNAEAEPIVSELRKLYLLERHAREEALNAEQRQAVRTEKAKPILEAMRPRLEAVREKNLPQSPLGKAARYALNEWAALTRYLEDGRLEIDNNLTENAIRPSAVGKKNWLFIGHPDAGWRAAVIYTLIVSCRRRGIEPWEYLRDVLQRLPAMKQSEITTLLPAHWKPA
jgi:transposase